MKLKIVALTTLVFVLSFIITGIVVSGICYLLLFHLEWWFIMAGVTVVIAILHRIWTDIYDAVEKWFNKKEI